MIVTLYLCMPEGESMRQQFARYMNAVKDDNRRVISAMLRAGIHVPDTVGEMGLTYSPEQHRLGEDGEPVMDIYGMRMMVERGSFSCGDAAAYEAAVLEEKYRIPAECLSVAQGDDDMHGVFVTPQRVVDPTLNFLEGRRDVLRVQRTGVRTQQNSCSIEDGRVVCTETPVCCVDENGVWSCPSVPGLSGRRESITSVQGLPGSQWASTEDGAVVPMCPRPKRRLR